MVDAVFDAVVDAVEHQLEVERRSHRRTKRNLWAWYMISSPRLLGENMIALLPGCGISFGKARHSCTMILLPYTSERSVLMHAWFLFTAGGVRRGRRHLAFDSCSSSVGCFYCRRALVPNLLLAIRVSVSSTMAYHSIIEVCAYYTIIRSININSMPWYLMLLMACSSVIRSSTA